MNRRNASELDLEPSDITSEVCNKCIKSGPPYCCEISLGYMNQESKAYLDLVATAIEGYDNIRTIPTTGEVRLICSHLDKEKGVCTIYETRPQMCRVYNCVSWAHVDLSRGAPKELLEVYNKVEQMLSPKKDDEKKEKMEWKGW